MSTLLFQQNLAKPEGGDRIRELYTQELKNAMSLGSFNYLYGDQEKAQAFKVPRKMLEVQRPENTKN